MDFGDDDELVPAGELDVRTAALQQTVAAVVVRPCACGAALCGHGAVLAVVLGFKNRPRCPDCLARELGEAPRELAERALQWIVRRECFVHVWRRASAAEGHTNAERPACLFVAGAPAPATNGGAPTTAVAALAPTPHAHWNAGDLGCGDLVLELRYRLRALPAGGVLAVRALDPAAPVDLPAWCGLCGHTLLRASHPDYLIQRKRD
ncbi:MAG: hypothetical protein WAT39_02545 [Planctomycetota bacterium]